MQTNNIFEKLKDLDLKTYLEDSGYEIRNNKMVCPFHEEKTPSLSIKGNFFKCFGCGAAGDAVKFEELLNKVTPLEAARIVCNKTGISWSDEYPSQARATASTPPRKKTKQDLAKLKAKDTARKIAEASDFTQEYETLRENLVLHFGDAKKLLNIFIQNERFNEFRNNYVGYDLKNNSLAISVRARGKTYNVKTRDIIGMAGKWIGKKGGVAFPFPLDLFMPGDPDVFLCEGEKDALNLHAIGVNALTLGGVAISWVGHLELLKGKNVFIFFDNDAAGYENAIKTYNEIKDVCNPKIIILYKIPGVADLKYDVSDLLFAKNIKSWAELSGVIAYASFNLTNELIDDISDYLNIDLSKYKIANKILTTDELLTHLLSKDEKGNYRFVTGAAGELDNDYIDFVLKDMADLKKHGGADIFAKELMARAENAGLNTQQFGSDLKAFFKFCDVKTTLLSNYRQVHLIDMLHAFFAMVANAKISLAEYKNRLCFWNGFYYSVVEDKILTDFIHQRWMIAAKIDYKKQLIKNVTELLENIKSKSKTLDTIKELQKRRYIAFKNGTLVITDNKAIFKNIHQEADACTTFLDFEYDPQATAPKWQKFLSRVLPDPDDQKTLMEFLGYILLPNHNYEKFLLLYGESGANGKSIIMDVFSSFFGDENVSHLQLQDFTGHSLEVLKGKVLNIGSEIDSRNTDNGQISTLKALVSTNDKINIDPKFEKSYRIGDSEKPKLIFSSNTKIKTSLDKAVFRRMLFLEFKEEIKDDEKIRGLSRRFDDEKAGILNMGIEGLKRLISQGGFTESSGMRAGLEEYKIEVNPITAYIRDNLIVNPDYMVPKILLYAHYKEWSNQRGARTLSEQNFWAKLKKEIDTLTDVHLRNIKVMGEYRDRVRFITGFYVAGELYEFAYKNKEVLTSDINYSCNLKMQIRVEAYEND